MRAGKWIGRVLTVIGALLLGAVIYLGLNYVHQDQETAELNDTARRGTTGSYVQLPDGVTHYELAGPEGGRTIVLIHGFSVPYYVWDPTFDGLVKAGFRVLRYDLYGRGYSDRPDEKYGVELYDRQLLNLLTALKIQGPVDVAGVSMGGPIAVIFSARHPEKVRTISLFDPAYFTGGPIPWQLRTPVVGEYIMDAVLGPKLSDSQRDDFVHPERYPDYFPRYAVQMRYRGFRRALLSSVRYFFHHDDGPEYRQVGQSHKPVLLIWGREDKDVPFEVSRQVLDSIPQAKFHPIDDAAHVPFYEHPEVVNPLLIEFLQKN
jgi:pimeloyl-ACP methyl ester carboxylesterase